MLVSTSRAASRFVLLGIFAFTSAAWGQLLNYNFDAQTAAPSLVDANLSASNFSSLNSNTYSQGNPSSGWAYSSSGFTSNNYFSFTLTPHSGSSLNLSSLEYDDRISKTGPRGLTAAYSINGGSYTNIGSANTSKSFSSTPMVSMNLSSIGALQSLTSPVTFRLTGTGARSSSGTCRMDNVSIGGSASGSQSTGTLRIVNWNTASDGGYGAPTLVRTGFETVFQAMGAEHVGNVQRNVDVMAVEEQSSTKSSSGASITTDDIVTRLNAIYGDGYYADVPVTGGSNGGGTQAIVYNTHTVSVVATKAVGTLSTSGMARQELRYQVRPAGTSGSQDFYLYAGHWKASDDSTSRSRRDVEAQTIKNDAASLGSSARVIFAGDYNVYNASEAAWQTLTSSGTGQAFDPADQVGEWDNNPAFIGIDSQAPAVDPGGSLIGGGLDDRFDFETVTAPVLTPGGLQYIDDSYHSFGNNGSVALNGNINDPSNTALADLANRLEVLDDLATVSDHLPVMADFSYSLGGAPMSVVPEPTAALSLLAIGLLSLRRRRRAAA